MEISKTFLVRAPVDAAWSFLTDPTRVAACLPGAAITDRVDDLNYRGTITVKVGPVSASYRGTMRFARLDPSTHSAEIVASGSETRGRGGADMVMNSRLVSRTPGETEVTVTSQVNVMGVLAQFGRGMIQDVSDQIFERFVAAVRAELEGEAGIETPAAATAEPGSPGPAPANAPIDVLSLGSGVIGRAAMRAAQRPAVWAGAALVVALAFLWFRHRRGAAARHP